MEFLNERSTPTRGIVANRGKKASMEKCCNKSVTTYIVCTAHEFCGEQHGEDFATKMLNEAGITMTNKQDAEIIKSLGQEYVDTVNRLTGE